VGHVSGAGYLGRYDEIYNITTPVKEGRHETELNLDLVRALGLEVKKTTPSIHIPGHAMARAEKILSQALPDKRPVLAVQIGSSDIQPWKRWRLERWSRLIQKILRKGAHVVILGAAEETAQAETLCFFDASEGSGVCTNMAGRITLAESAAVVKMSRLLVCADSSLMHVAAAVGTPHVVLWGPTEYDRTHPLSKNGIVLRKPCKCSGSLFSKEVVNSIWRCTQPCLDTSVEVALKAIMGLVHELPTMTPPVPNSFGTNSLAPCPLCSARKTLVLFKFNFSKWQKASKTWLRKCRCCGLLFNWPRPTRAEIKSFYGSNYYVFKRNDADTFQRLIPIYARTVRMVEGLVNKKMALDIGCAGGHLLAIMRAVGWDAHGVEISPEASDYARDRWNVPVFTGSIEEFSGQGKLFSLITAIDVLEHVPNPHDFLKAIAKVSEPGAYLVVDTPNAGAFHIKAMGATWRGFNPFHIQLFTVDSLRALSEPLGFELLKSFSYNNVYPKADGPSFQLPASQNSSDLNRIAKIASHYPLYTHSKDATRPLAQNCQGENLVVISRFRGR
jgi:SAM-dependent methyltransferase